MQGPLRLYIVIERGRIYFFLFPAKSGKSLSVFLDRLRVRLNVDKLAIFARLNQPGFERDTQVVILAGAPYASWNYHP